MEESTNDIETNQSFKSPPRRRRSTFFERRESFVPQPMSENVDMNVCKQNSEPEEKRLEELSRYYDKLLAEKNEWKNEVKNRRNKYHDLRQQYQMTLQTPATSKMSSVISALSTEDIQFLEAKMNISTLVEHQMKLHKSVKETRALYRRACEMDDVILSEAEENVNIITEYIFENSTVDAIE